MKSSSNKRSSFGRRVLWGTGLLSLLGGLAITAASCGTLPDINAGQCGNRVVEPANGEACDERKTGKCGLPSSYAPCQYICNDEVSCETGYGCGLDGICRQSGGLSDLPISIGGVGAQQLLRGDFDGDGRDEIVTANGNIATVHFLTTEGFITSSKSFPYSGGTPAIGDLNGDGLADMVLNLGQTMSIWLGQEDRTLIPQTQPIMYSARATQRLIPLGTYVGDAYILALTDGASDNGASFIQFGPDGNHRLDSATSTKLPLGKVHGTVATKAFTENGKACGMMAAALEAPMGQPLIQSRVGAAKRCEDSKYIEQLWDIKLGMNSPWAGVFFRDIDKDGTDEVLYGVDYGLYQSLMMDKFGADGKPLGTPVPYLDHEPGNCLPMAQLSSAPLAIADLNNDGHIDFVDSRGVLLSNSEINPKPYKRVCHSYTSFDPMDPLKIAVSWTSAVIGDVNGDGKPDLVASRKNQNIVDLWIWKPDGIATVPLSVPGPVQDLVGGDLDGDSITDLVFRLVPPPGDALAPTSIFAMFGNPLGIPSTPQSIGTIRGVKQLVVGRFQGANQLGEADLYDDLLVLADEWEFGKPPTGESPLTLIQGSSTRTLVAPLILQENTRTNLDFGIGGGNGPERDIHGIAISDFGIPFDYNDPLGLAPSNIVVAAGSKIWTAGFQKDGSSFVVKDNLPIGNTAVALTPADDLEPNMSSPANPYVAHTTTLGVFTGTVDGPGLWFIDQIGTNQFVDGYEDLDLLKPKVRLPSAEQPDVPYIFADLDANGKRDLVLVAEEMDTSGSLNRTIVVYWNGDATLASMPFDLNKVTPFPFKPQVDFGPPGGTMPDGGMSMMPDTTPVDDIAAINFDGDEFLEVAILSRGNIYIAKIDLQDPVEDQPLQVTTSRDLALLNEGAPVAQLPGGNSLLTIDANSDGIDDLVVGDISKLLLFFGTERPLVVETETDTEEAAQ